MLPIQSVVILSVILKKIRNYFFADALEKQNDPGILPTMYEWISWPEDEQN